MKSVTNENRKSDQSDHSPKTFPVRVSTESLGKPVTLVTNEPGQLVEEVNEVARAHDLTRRRSTQADDQRIDHSMTAGETENAANAKEAAVPAIPLFVK